MRKCVYYMKTALQSEWLFLTEDCKEGDSYFGDLVYNNQRQQSNDGGNCIGESTMRLGTL